MFRRLVALAGLGITGVLLSQEKTGLLPKVAAVNPDVTTYSWLGNSYGFVAFWDNGTDITGDPGFTWDGINGLRSTITGTNRVAIYGECDSTGGTGVEGNGGQQGVYGRGNNGGICVLAEPNDLEGLSIPLVALGAKNQTANLQEWQLPTLTGTNTLSVVDVNGNIGAGVGLTPPGAPIHGLNSTSTGTSVGVLGVTENLTTPTLVMAGVQGVADTGYGVYGVSNTGDGVYGLSQGTTGVFGSAAAPTGNTIGVFGQSISTTGKGVWGYAGAGTGKNFGVYGESVSTSGIGVFGSAAASNGNTIGVYGLAESTSGIGVLGQAGNDGVIPIVARAYSLTQTGHLQIWQKWDGTAFSVVDSTGELGLGTATPGSALDVNGAFSVRGMGAPSLSPASQGRIYFDSTANRFMVSENGGAYANLTGSTLAGWGLSGNSGTNPSTQFLGTTDSEDLAFRTNSSERMRIMSGGNVGIGTASPNQALDVTGNGRFSTGLISPVLKPNSDSTTALQLQTAAGTNILNVDTTNSRIGIGTKSPAVKLGIQPAAYSTALDGIEFQSSDNSQNAIIQPVKIPSGATNLFFGSNAYVGTTGKVQRFASGVPAAYINMRASDGSFNLLTATSTGSLATPNFVVTSAGRVGIGTSSPAYKLDVAGSVHATSFPTSSDMRFKEDIQPIDNALDKVLQLQGIYFKWNHLHRDVLKRDNTTTRQVGLIAQNVREVLPEVVSEWADQGADDYLAVDYNRLVAVLIQAMKEQQEQIKNENGKLQERIAILERTVKQFAAS